MPVHEHASVRLSGDLAPLVSRLVGYRHEGLDPGTHLGLPGSSLTLVISLGEPTHMLGMPDPAQAPARLQALVGGLHTRPAVIGYEHSLFGVQLDLTPRGSRSLLGLPASELVGAVVDLEDVLGYEAHDLIEALAQVDSWPERFALLQRTLRLRIDSLEPVGDPIEAAWQKIIASGGSARIGDVAAAVGFSRRQLDVRFTREYGLAPKQLARVVRFERSHRLLRSAPGMRLAAAAAACGYYDQPHMAREWRSLAGYAPSRWLAEEELPFVQDERGLTLPI